MTLVEDWSVKGEMFASFQAEHSQRKAEIDQLRVR